MATVAKANVVLSAQDKSKQAFSSFNSRLRGVNSALTGAAAKMAAFGAAVFALTKVTNVTREFDKLNAGLITATGSAEKANVAFAAIQDFATRTPYDLQQVTDAFTKLVNYGLTPSEQALTSYGDIAASLGKDLNQMIEAVADAATGEFERLKEFGIKASKQGDQIKFTFRGVTQTVANNSAAIEQYLIKLGQNNFAGAMAQRMDTLDGAMSNLGDEWDKLWLNISKAGVGDAIEGAARKGIDALVELNDMVASGQMAGYLGAIAGKFRGFGDDVVKTLEILGDMWDAWLGTTDGQGIAGATNETIKFIKSAFKNLPENIRVVVQLMAVEIASLVDYAKAYGAAFTEVLGLQFVKLVEKAKVYGKAIGNALNPFSDDNYDADAQLAKIDSLAAEMANEAFKRASAEADAIAQARRDSIQSIIDEHTESIATTEREIDAAGKLREEYEKLKSEREAAGKGTDSLVGFKITAPAGAGDAGTIKGTADIDRVRSALMSEEDALAESLQKRLEIIDAAKISENERLDLAFRAHVDYEERITAIKQQEEDKRLQIAQSAHDAQSQLAGSLANNVVSFARSIAPASKEAALIGIGIEKAQAIAATKASTLSASMLAYASQIVPGDPTSLARAEVARQATLSLGAANVALIAATGLAQAAGSMSGGGGGGGGAGGGAVGSAPQIAQPREQEREQRQIQVIIHGDVNDSERFREKIVEALRESDDRDTDY